MEYLLSQKSPSLLHRRIGLPLAKFAVRDARIFEGTVPAPVVHHLGVVVAGATLLVLVGARAVIVQDAVGAERARCGLFRRPYVATTRQKTAS